MVICMSTSAQVAPVDSEQQLDASKYLWAAMDSKKWNWFK